MKYVVFTIAVFVLLAFNSELARLFLNTPVRFNLLLLFVVFSALDKKDTIFLFLAFFCGLVLDAFHSAPFGSFLLSFIVIASALNKVAKTFWVYELNWKFIALFIGLATIAAELLPLLLAKVLPGTGVGSFQYGLGQFGARVFYSLLVNLALAIPLYFYWLATKDLSARLEGNKSFF